MAKYRIKIEALDPAEELRAEYRIGIECEGFTIIANRSDGHQTAIHDMNRADIVDCMVSNQDMMEAACIARGFFEAKSVARRFDEEKVMSRIARSFAEKLRED